MGKPTVRVVVDAPHGSDVVAMPHPVLGWITETDISGWRQAAAELRLSRASGEETSVIEGRESSGVPWPFTPLAPREQVFVTVRTRGEDGSASDWSAPQRIFAGFLGAGEWQAETIGLPAPAAHGQPAFLRTCFVVDGVVSRAILYATAVGVYQAALNGVDVDDQVLKPGWTAYEERVIHETTDVTDLLVEGENAIGVRLAGAWATEVYGFSRHRGPKYAEQPRFAAQLRIDYADGRVAVVPTDARWRVSTGPIVSSGLYAGESYDARLEHRDGEGRAFTVPGFDDAEWSTARVELPVPVPEARISPFVRRIEERAVQDVIRTPSGRTVVDFGQNLVGRLRIRVSGPAGTIVTLRHAEVLENGELGTRPLRRAEATDSYVLRGEGIETWEPEFTFHGFRYAEIAGWPGEFDPSDVTAVIIHSDMERTGWFASSHPMLDRLHENVVWGLRGNFLYLPTDCPQRDERLGWTGDIQVFAPTASFLYDVRGFLDSWLVDLTVEQRRYGGVVPFVVPNVLTEVQPAAAWGDAATVVPWVLHERFGDAATLERQYDSMKQWVDTIAEIAGERRLWEGRFQYGDWLDPDAPPEFPDRAKAAADIVASAYFFRSTDLVARAARLLGRQEDAAVYRALAEEVREAFLAEYVTPAGRMMSDAPTAYALAIVFGIAADDLVADLGRRLAELTRESGYRIGTGFVGTPIILDALTVTGHAAAAERLLLQTENPSWLYPVTMGATTIWERWDSMLPDGSINPGEMTSFNHYALGAVADWLHRRVAGLAPAEPGYRRILVEPLPLRSLQSASAEHRTAYGTTAVSWSRAGGEFRVRLDVPPNADALVRLPDGSEYEVGAGRHEWAVPDVIDVPTSGYVSLDTDLATVIDDQEAYAELVRILDAEDPENARALRANTVWSPGQNLRESVLRLATPDVQRLVAERFSALNAGRG
jgi:alpha-L-rhamnosidase